jgi:hypothetical protein
MGKQVVREIWLEDDEQNPGSWDKLMATVADRPLGGSVTTRTILRGIERPIASSAPQEGRDADDNS